MKPKNTTKKTLYIDVEEEITGIIDKLRSVDESVVAMVVPKRASVFTSIVNLKLLKRAADNTSKRLVLVTTNSSVVPLAGNVGLHIAESLQSKPYIPKAAAVEKISLNDTDSPIAVTAPSQLDVEEPVSKVPKEEKVLPNIPIKAPAAGAAASAAASKAKSPKKPKFKVPNFKRFRILLISGIILLILLLVGGYWALAIAPKATVTLRGETSNKELSLKVLADPEAESLDAETGVVPAQNLQIKKTETERVPATGEKDTGNKASGTVALRNCSDNSITVPAGVGVSSGGLTYITQEAAELEEGDFTSSGTCKTSSPTQNVAVIAQNAGDKYNAEKKSYTVAGYSKIQAEGSAMTGGTSNIVKIVSAGDIETAKAKLNEKTVGAIQELKTDLTRDGFVPLEDTFNSAPGAYIPTPAADSEATEVAVSVEMTYSMLGIKESDLKEYVQKRAEAEGKLDSSKESLLEDGLAAASYQLGGTANGVTTVNINSRIVTGPELNQDQIKQEIAGKNRGEAERLLADRPGVTEARVETGPFWNLNVPKKLEKITVTVQE